jgi:hypothetical protein
MVSSAAAASSQRRRWEEGRKELVQKNATRLLRLGLGTGNKILTDLALDLLIPPLSRIAAAALFGVLVAFGLSYLAQRTALSLFYFGFCVFALVSYVLRGWSVSGTGLRGLLDLGLAPVYVIWKARLRLTKASRPTQSWVRTKREQQSE